jgi:hypothetical protein
MIAVVLEEHLLEAQINKPRDLQADSHFVV